MKKKYQVIEKANKIILNVVLVIFVSLGVMIPAQNYVEHKIVSITKQMNEDKWRAITNGMKKKQEALIKKETEKVKEKKKKYSSEIDSVSTSEELIDLRLKISKEVISDYVEDGIDFSEEVVYADKKIIELQKKEEEERKKEEKRIKEERERQKKEKEAHFQRIVNTQPDRSNCHLATEFRGAPIVGRKKLYDTQAYQSYTPYLKQYGDFCLFLVPDYFEKEYEEARHYYGTEVFLFHRESAYNNPHIITHELGHAVDDNYRFSGTQEWQDIYHEEWFGNGTYGGTKSQEAFAESVAIYIHDNAALKNWYPKSWEYMHRLLN